MTYTTFFSMLLVLLSGVAAADGIQRWHGYTSGRTCSLARPTSSSPQYCCGSNPTGETSPMTGAQESGPSSLSLPVESGTWKTLSHLVGLLITVLLVGTALQRSFRGKLFSFS